MTAETSSHDPVEINPMTDSGEVSARGHPTQAASGAVPEQTEPGSPPLPWAYRPQEMDDWGCIRSADGRTVAHIRSPWIDVHGDDANAHRRARTDPYGETARLIVRAVNAHDDLVAALEAAQEELRLIQMKDTNAVYNPMLRMQMALALEKAKSTTGGR